MNGHKCDGCRYKGEHQEMGFKPFGVCYKETNLIKAEANYNAETCPYRQKIFITNAGLDIKKPYKTPYDKKIAEAARELSGEEKTAYLPKLYKIEGVDLAEPEQWPKENPYIIMTPDLKDAAKDYAEACEREKEKITEIITPIIKEVADRLTPIIKHITETLPSVVKALGDFMEQIINLYPNKRVIYLAKHGRKKRTRKKNINRIKRYFEREAKKRPEFAQN